MQDWLLIANGNGFKLQRVLLVCDLHDFQRRSDRQNTFDVKVILSKYR